MSKGAAPLSSIFKILKLESPLRAPVFGVFFPMLYTCLTPTSRQLQHGAMHGVWRKTPCHTVTDKEKQSKTKTHPASSAILWHLQKRRHHIKRETVCPFNSRAKFSFLNICLRNQPQPACNLRHRQKPKSNCPQSLKE
jgi:hypothetical protein